MKFRKFGKAFLMSTLSAGVVFGLSSCVQSYTVGFLYVTGVQTSGNTGQGIISGFKIDHNTGQLRNINGLPVSSGGSWPVRSVLIQSQRFFYVLNQGRDASGGNNCTSATSPCTGSNITLFTVGGNGILSSQPQIFKSQGKNPMRMIADAPGNFVMVLDHDAPDSGVGATNSCSLALGAGVTTCGDITVFHVDPTTGRLNVVINAQVTSASGQPLTYFPVPHDPIDFVLQGAYVMTLSGNPAEGDVVFPYNYGLTNGQLTISQNGVQPLNSGNGGPMRQGTSIQTGNSNIYVLDNEPVTINAGANSVFQSGTYPGQILPFTVGSGGALQAQTGGAVPIDASQSNPLFMYFQGTKWAYVADTGNNQNQNNPQSGITGYVIDTQTQQLTPMSGSPFGNAVGIGAGPQCLVEDPSNQFIYTANYNGSNVTGVVLDQNSGVLRQLPGKAASAYPVPGPATFCVVNGRTS